MKAPPDPGTLRRRLVIWSTFVIGLAFGVLNLFRPNFSMLTMRHEPWHLCMIFWTVACFVASNPLNWWRIAAQAILALLFSAVFRNGSWGPELYYLVRFACLAGTVYIFAKLNAEAAVQPSHDDPRFPTRRNHAPNED